MFVLLMTLLLFTSQVFAQMPPLAYDLVYVRSPRAGDATFTPIPDVFAPFALTPGTDLVWRGSDGVEEVLVAGGSGAVLDPAMCLDGTCVYYAYCPDVRPGAANTQIHQYAWRAGCDLYRLDLATRATTRLTHQEWTPNGGAGVWSTQPLSGAPGSNYLGHGIFNSGPCPLPDGRIMFTSSRNGFKPNKNYTWPNMQLFVMDADGRHVEQVGFFNLGSVLHPTLMQDGRVMFVTYETMGLRDKRLWGVWAMWPDGRDWEPLISAFIGATSLSWPAQATDKRLYAVPYYNGNNAGAGTLLSWPPFTDMIAQARWGSPTPSGPGNPILQWGFFTAQGLPTTTRIAFSPYGLTNSTPFAHWSDQASGKYPDGTFAGKVAHPSGAPANDLLLSYCKGPCNDLLRPVNMPVYDFDIVVLRGTAATPADLVPIAASTLYNEMQPRAAVPWKTIYTTDPVILPWLPNDGTADPARLPRGTAFGEVGTSSFYNRATTPGVSSSTTHHGLEPFNAGSTADVNWITQGADAGRYSNADIHAVRLVTFEPQSARPYGPAPNQALTASTFFNHGTERLRILGEIPLRKVDANGQVITDYTGVPDTSFLAKIPADVPFTFQTLDANGMVLNMSQTWHQVRPGELKNNCGGCHAHDKTGVSFPHTQAGRADYPVQMFTTTHTVEYYRDIKPILYAKCVSCHTGVEAPARLVLDDTSLVSGYENTYHRLANDPTAKYGYKSVQPSGGWFGTNVSRYVRPYQSRRSLLTWKVWGQRLDGWTNAEHQTEEVPGDRTTLPNPAQYREADLDYVAGGCTAHEVTTADEKRLVATWIDLGAPISRQDAPASSYAWFLGELPPTLAVTFIPKVVVPPVTCPSGCVPEVATPPPIPARVLISHFDFAGIDPQTLRVTLDGVDVTAQLMWDNEEEGVKALVLEGEGQGEVTAQVCDQPGPSGQPNCTRRSRTLAW